MPSKHLQACNDVGLPLARRSSLHRRSIVSAALPEQAVAEYLKTFLMFNVCVAPVTRVQQSKHITCYLQLGLLRPKQLTNTLKRRIWSQTSIIYFIRNVSAILTVGFQV